MFVIKQTITLVIQIQNLTIAWFTGWIILVLFNYGISWWILKLNHDL